MGLGYINAAMVYVRTRGGQRGRQRVTRSAAVPIIYTNAKGKTYYLHQGTTKTGKPKYHFSMENNGALAEAIPEGFEIYENPNAQVFLRRMPPKIVTDEECQVVEEGMRKYAEVQDYKIDVKGNAIVVYTPNQSVEEFAQLLKGLNPFVSETQVREFFARSVQYSPMLQFVLDDEKRRTFTAQRYCFMGAIDDWIDIGYGPLTTLVERYVKHLGQASYFELL
jgi:hypothetical protein